MELYSNDNDGDLADQWPTTWLLTSPYISAYVMEDANGIANYTPTSHQPGFGYESENPVLSYVFNSAPASVPESTTMIAGALELLLPFGASVLWSLRKRQVA